MKFRKTLILLAAFSLATLTGPAVAQNAPAGPVHFPAPVASGTLTTPPAPSSPPPASPSTAPTGDIHDIRGPITIPYAWLWLLYLAGGLAVAVSLYAAWRLFRRQTSAKSKQPFEVALEQLEAARKLMTEGTVREYAFVVSEIIRVYIEQRFGERAAHRTTEEFMSDLLQQTDTPLALHHDRLADFLGHCDLPKFARWQLSVSEMESMHESARVFVLETRPRPEPAKPREAAPTSGMPDASAEPELLHSK